MAAQPPDPRTLLRARLEDYLLGCFLSLGLVLLSGVPLLFFTGGEFVAVALVLGGIWLASATGLKAMAIRRDLQDGVVTERCRVIQAVRVRLSVRTSRGTIALVNHTGRDGRELARRWVLLTYAPHAGLALRAEDV